MGSVILDGPPAEDSIGQLVKKSEVHMVLKYLSFIYFLGMGSRFAPRAQKGTSPR